MVTTLCRSRSHNDKKSLQSKGDWILGKRESQQIKGDSNVQQKEAPTDLDQMLSKTKLR